MRFSNLICAVCPETFTTLNQTVVVGGGESSVFTRRGVSEFDFQQKRTFYLNTLCRNNDDINDASVKRPHMNKNLFQDDSAFR